MTKEDLPDVRCSRCASPETRPVRRFGRPMEGESPRKAIWQCLECGRQFDGPLVRR